jgi:hypothetical protein
MRGYDGTTDLINRSNKQIFIYVDVFFIRDQNGDVTNLTERNHLCRSDKDKLTSVGADGRRPFNTMVCRFLTGNIRASCIYGRPKLLIVVRR